MTTPRHNSPPDADRSWLSAAADGDADALDRVARAWRDDADTQAAWHRYHLIGDALRSSELARPAKHDADFLKALRERLAAEPVVLAPPAMVAAARRPASRWAVPVAVAAGFVVVAGVLVVSRTAGPLGVGVPDLRAGASGPAGVTTVSAVAGSANGPGREVGAVLRDARVDELLRAHQSARGGMAVPGSELRQVDNVVSVEAAR